MSSYEARADELRDVAADDELMEIGRRAVEDVLIDWRESRMGPETAVRIALRAIADHIGNGGAS